MDLNTARLQPQTWSPVGIFQTRPRQWYWECREVEGIQRCTPTRASPGHARYLPETQLRLHHTVTFGAWYRKSMGGRMASTWNSPHVRRQAALPSPSLCSSLRPRPCARTCSALLIPYLHHSHQSQRLRC